MNQQEFKIFITQRWDQFKTGSLEDKMNNWMKEVAQERSSNTLKAFPVIDDISTNSYPTPIFGEGKNDVFVGRLRQDISNETAINLWAVSDNLIKGAALNAIQILEVFQEIG